MNIGKWMKKNGPAHLEVKELTVLVEIIVLVAVKSVRNQAIYGKIGYVTKVNGIGANLMMKVMKEADGSVMIGSG